MRIYRYLMCFLPSGDSFRNAGGAKTIRICGPHLDCPSVSIKDPQSPNPEPQTQVPCAVWLVRVDRAIMALLGLKTPSNLKGPETPTLRNSITAEKQNFEVSESTSK